MADFKSLDDIEREKHEREREKRKERIVEDINSVFEKVKERRSEEAAKKKKKRSLIKKIIFALLTLGLLLLVINFVLGNVWLLKFFIKSLFG